MDRIADESGISKTSIYNHFRTKEELILAVLRLRDEKFRNWLYRRMGALADGPYDQLLALFDALSEWFDDKDFRGCMFMKASSEYQDPSHPIHKQSAEHKQMLEDYFTKLAHLANLEHPRTVARKLLILKEGATVTAQLRACNNAANDAKAMAVALLARHSGRAAQ
jgi:AcrR family transcriptional regulator